MTKRYRKEVFRLDKYNLAWHLTSVLKFIPENWKKNVDDSLQILNHTWKTNFTFSPNRMQCIISTCISQIHVNIQTTKLTREINVNTEGQKNDTECIKKQAKKKIEGKQTFG